MQAPSQFHPPKNWQDFEDLCLALWERELDCPNIQKNGRPGQKQNGVDIVAQRRDSPHHIGIQCKLKVTSTGAKGFLTTEEIAREIKAAKSFRPRLSELGLGETRFPDCRKIAFKNAPMIAAAL
jgi:Restriction endonuclease